MPYLRILLLALFVTTSCQQSVKEAPVDIDAQLTEAAFTPFEEIDPNIYFPTEANIAIDPNNEVMDMFRKKKAADMANPEKPRPMDAADIWQIENRTSENDWEPVEDHFDFEWDQIGLKALANFRQNVKTRKAFANPDLKVVEIAIAPGASLPSHAQATPSVYHILGGTALVWSADSCAAVSTGTSIKFDSYEAKRVEVTSEEPLKILWFSWAPEGNKSYLESGYYLTGSNLHYQPLGAVMPHEYEFWPASVSTLYEFTEPERTLAEESNFVKSQIKTWEELSKKAYYPNDPKFKSEQEVDWVDMIKLDPKSFFFAKDIMKLGESLKIMKRMAKIKSVFRVHRPDSGYDLNYSYLAWGPQSKYVTHSHAICEFYYLLEGDVEYIVNGESYHATAGNFYFHPPYYDHEMRGLKEGVPFLSISGSWIPYGDRSLFERKFLLLEDISTEKSNGFPADFDFHDFKMNDQMKYGIL